MSSDVLTPEGVYPATIVDHWLATAKTGTPQLVVVVEIDGVADLQGAPLRRRIYRAITERSLPYLAEDLIEMGFMGSTLADLSSKAASGMAGRKIRVRCKHEHTRSGGVSERWYVLKPDSGDASKNNVDADSLDRRFGRALSSELRRIRSDRSKSAPGKEASRNPSPPRGDSGPGISEDDIPF